MDKRHIGISKFLSYVLRHRPDSIGLSVDAQGWVDIADLLVASRVHGQPISRDDLELVVADNNKKRFAISEDGQRIRASQGHSLQIDLGYEPASPPEVLYHGTGRRFLASIVNEGLIKGRRHHVHLSSDKETAHAVGTRHGVPVVLVIQSGRMARDGHLFYLSANAVWLTDHVPPAYIEAENP